MSDGSLIVRYRLKLSDRAAFNLYHFSRSALIWSVWVALVFFTVKGELQSRPGPQSLAHLVAHGISAAFMVSLVFCAFLGIVIAISLFSRRRGNILSEHALEITEDGVINRRLKRAMRRAGPAFRNSARHDDICFCISVHRLHT
jgi:hypothetical protein